MTIQNLTIKPFRSIAIPFAVMVLIISAIALLFAASYESDRFYQEQSNIAKSSVQGVHYNLGQYIENKKAI